MKKLNKQELNGGFTLIELVVVMAIIAVLAVLIVGAIIIARNTAKETANRSNAKVVQTAFEAKYASNRTYPALSGNFNAAANLTALGLTATSLSSTACTDTGGGTISSTTAGYTLSVNTSACGANFNASDAITGP